jgi:hypothetical protein
MAMTNEQKIKEEIAKAKKEIENNINKVKEAGRRK